MRVRQRGGKSLPPIGGIDTSLSICRRAPGTTPSHATYGALPAHYLYSHGGGCLRWRGDGDPQ